MKVTILNSNINSEDWNLLSLEAWKVRENSYILSRTKVGAAVLTKSGIFSGCNVQTIYRNDLHAEVNAISNMVANGVSKFDAILIAAEREKFTPCGSCMDWIVQFGIKNCVVGVQKEINGEIDVYRIEDLMPHYPK